MTKVACSELTEYKGNKTLNNLDGLATEMKKAGRLFDNFAAYSGRRLKGEGYDAIRVVAAFAAQAFNKIGTLDMNTHDNINAGLSTFIGFMEDYDRLDDSKTIHLGDGLKYIGTQIGMLQSRINKGDFEGDDLSHANNQLSYWYTKYNELLKEYNKLKDLASVDASTGACLDNISSDIGSLRTILVDNWR